MIERPANDWEQVLREVGVPAVTAEGMGPVFASTVKAGTFSKGEEDLLDFLPTVLHESAMMTKLKESGWYSSQRIAELGRRSPRGSRWRSLVPRAHELARNSSKFFEACYGGRMGNGPEGTGDGALYPGRGFIGVTGKDNYRWLSDHSGQDLIHLPWLLEGPYFALELSIDWWEGKIPDRILGDDRAIRRVVNGGYFGLEDVEHLARLVRKAMS